MGSFFKDKKHCTGDGAPLSIWPKKFYITMMGHQNSMHVAYFDTGNIFDTREEADDDAKHNTRIYDNPCYVLEIKKLGHWKEVEKPTEFVEENGENDE